MDILTIKLRFGIIGNSLLLDRAIDVARQVAPTEITVFITGESGTGKEVFPKIIHQLSARKHGPYIAVNCGAIPEGTIDSELFGHEKGSFTGAHEARKGYFEVVDGGTIFLDEVAELPLSTQVRLLRVLETGEFMKVGSSNVIKTNVRVVAATNINVNEAIKNGKFREDLYYRLNTVPIVIPPLRERKEDIVLLFRKFATDFAEKYRMPALQLDEDSQRILNNYSWPGNIRQLKNLTEQISIIEKSRLITGDIIRKYLPESNSTDLPVLLKRETPLGEHSERDILYKILFDMKQDITDLKKLVIEIIETDDKKEFFPENKEHILEKLYQDIEPVITNNIHKEKKPNKVNFDEIEDTEEYIEENLSLEKKEKDVIIKALDKHKGRKRNAAKELGISERTLYRKLKEYNLEEQ
ncbi:MAG: sigma-54-dependent Fis family transcriptional regulator [Bacteroidetes bacterium CG2_30_32_10]|nr:MAG: sigma-54-dependent Fis family transcriptional regulator [Bacteroidetes bacterium CG2_30_32_10]